MANKKIEEGVGVGGVPDEFHPITLGLDLLCLE